MTERILFTSMDHGAQADYDLLDEIHAYDAGHLVEWFLGWLWSIDSDSPEHISRLERRLQVAARAERDGAEDETAICMLLRDIANPFAPASHLQVAVTLLQNYVGEKEPLDRKAPRFISRTVLFSFLADSIPMRVIAIGIKSTFKPASTTAN